MIAKNGGVCGINVCKNLDEDDPMARWPERKWTTWFTYLSIFVGFPVLSLLAYLYVRYGF
jgi:hypothetical protein